jgi:signal peptidase II
MRLLEGRFTSRLTLAATALVTIGCDRVTKQVAATALAGVPVRSYLGDMVRLSYAENAGAFLSLGATLPHAMRQLLFIGGTGATLGILGLFAWHYRWKGWLALGVTLFVAGGVSNWLDRATTGHVVDFLNVGIGPLRTGIFNVADMAIMAGALLAVVVEIKSTR